MSFRHRLFHSFLQAGFECSTHKRRCGRRLDLLEQTEHIRFAVEDFQRVNEFGIRTVRTGARWHLIEETPGKYHFDSLRPILKAAYETDTEIVLDLFHFGWPDHLDIFSHTFVHSFARYVRAIAHFMKDHRAVCRVFAPLNEISYFSWAGGDVSAINPYETNRGHELKRILVRAAVAGSEIIVNELPYARLLAPEPVINIVGNPEIPGDEEAARLYTLAQYESWDMVSGRLAPELGGRPEYLDIIGINFYRRNQWVNYAELLYPGDKRYKPFHKMLLEVWERYRRPLVVSETGTEDDERAGWFHYICGEVRRAIELGAPVHGICLYPIVNHPGWDDERHCCNGLFDYANADGTRETYLPLAEAINYQQQADLLRCMERVIDAESNRPDLFVSSSLGLCVSTSSTPDEPVCP